MRHIIALIGTLIFMLVYWVGYISGENSWLFTIIGVFFLYIVIYNLVEV